MKLVPTSLEESQSFYRGINPLDAMGIGVYQYLEGRGKSKVIKKEKYKDLTPEDLKPFSFSVYEVKKKKGTVDPDSIWIKISYEVNGDRKEELLSETLFKQLELSGRHLDPSYEEINGQWVKKKIQESVNFERGIEPKTAMKIGDAAILPGLIDSNILQAISLFDSYSKEDLKELSTMLVGEDKDDSAEEENYQLVKRAKNFLKGKATFGKSFDWKEEDAMIEYIEKNAKGRYVYNATPGMDSWEVVFSKVYLPRAEEIDI